MKLKTPLIDLTQEQDSLETDYYSIKSKLSNSSFKRFMECSARAYAEHSGEIVRASSDALIIGSYIDSMLFNEEVTVDTSSLYKKDGMLKKTNAYLTTIIDDIQEDKEFWKYLEGDYQKQKFFDFEGIPWKAKLDVDPTHFPDAIVDFKTAAKIEDWIYSKRFGHRVPFWYGRGYDIQGATYCEAWDRKRFILAIATKQEPSGRHIIEIPEAMLIQAREYIVSNQETVFAQMHGEKIEYCNDPECKYCRKNRKTILTVADVISTDKEERPF